MPIVCSRSALSPAILFLCWLLLAVDGQALAVSSAADASAEVASKQKEKVIDHHPAPWSGTYEAEYQRGVELLSRLSDGASADNPSPSITSSWFILIAGLTLCIGIGATAARLFAPKTNKTTAYHTDREQAAAELETKIALIRGRYAAKTASRVPADLADARDAEASDAWRRQRDKPGADLIDKVDKVKTGIPVDGSAGRSTPLPQAGGGQPPAEKRKQNKEQQQHPQPIVAKQSEKQERERAMPDLSLIAASAGQQESIDGIEQVKARTEESAKEPSLFIGERPDKNSSNSANQANAKSTRGPVQSNTAAQRAASSNRSGANLSARIEASGTPRAPDQGISETSARAASDAPSPQVIELVQDFEDLVNTTEVALRQNTFGQGPQKNIVTAIEKAAQLIKGAHTQYALRAESEQHLTAAIKQATQIITKALKENIDEESVRIRAGFRE